MSPQSKGMNADAIQVSGRAATVHSPLHSRELRKGVSKATPMKASKNTIGVNAIYTSRLLLVGAFGATASSSRYTRTFS